jgi:hypothetical protein
MDNDNLIYWESHVDPIELDLLIFCVKPKKHFNRVKRLLHKEYFLYNPLLYSNIETKFLTIDPIDFSLILNRLSMFNTALLNNILLHCPQLVGLRLESFSVLYKALPLISNLDIVFPTVQYLKLNNSIELDLNLLNYLKCFPSLKSLYITDYSVRTDRFILSSKDLHNLLLCLPKLEVLHIYSHTIFCSSSFNHLIDLRLDLANGKVYDFNSI